MSYSEVKDATSDAVGSEEEGSVFDKTIETYSSLRSKAEGLIISSLRKSFSANFKQYMSKPQWTTIGEVPQSSLLPFSHLMTLSNMLFRSFVHCRHR